MANETMTELENPPGAALASPGPLTRSSFVSSPAVPALTALIIILLGGLAVRVVGFGHYYFSPDDMLHIFIARGATLSEVLQRASGQVHPPLIFFLLHYMLLFSDQEIFLRGISLVPNLVSIAVAYFLGARLGSRAFGLGMAYFVAFSFALIIQSQVVRAYSLLVLLIILSLLFIVSYFQTGSARHLWRFSAAIFLAGLLHYSSVIVAGSIGMVWLARALFQSRARTGPPLGAEIRLILAAFAPAIGAGLFFFWLHLSRVFSSGQYSGLRDTYLSSLFFDDFPGLLANLRALVSYCSFSTYFPAVVILIVIGVLHLAIRVDRYVLAISLLAILISIGLALLRLYPLGGSRQCLVILPAVAILAGAGVEGIRSTVIRGYRMMTGNPGEPGKWASYFLVVALGVLVMVHVRYFSVTWHGLRPLDGQEFVVRRQAWSQIRKYLQTATTPGDVILADWQSFVYLAYLFPGGDIRRLGNAVQLQTPNHGLVYCPQADGCFWTGYDELSHSIGYALDWQQARHYTGGRIYLLDVGWIGDYKFWRDIRLHWALEPQIYASHEHLARIDSLGVQP